MKRNVTQDDFIQAFEDMGRGSAFSYEGLEALYDYLCELELGLEEELELDVIGLCCEYSEDTLSYYAGQYGIEKDIGEEDEDYAERVYTELAENTTVLYVTGDWDAPELTDRIIIRNY